ncbi:MAG TPA: serine hydrolase domain-containing protein [Actinomycetota bacterium]|nr:serine hydrolase domain-containing protein [Actinomycetota bacterium]
MPTRKQIDRGLETFVAAELERTGVPGVAVGVLHKGKRHIAGFGVTNIDHPLDVTPQTLFQIGSTTKTYTATAVMKLVEQGELDLGVPVKRYLPDLRLKHKQTEHRVTMKHLLTHTGGWIGDHFPASGRGEDALASVVATMAKVRQLTPLGEVWSYNNSGFYIAGRVLEEVVGKPYEEVINELLLRPLGMTSSFWFAEEVLPRRTAVGHIADGKRHRVAYPWALGRSSGPAGGLISDVGDQLTWAEFHMGDGRAPDGKRVLRQRTLRYMQQAHAPAGNIADHVGISWLLRDLGGARLVAHGGTTNGQLSAFVMVPEHGFAVTVLTNSTRGGEVHRNIVNRALADHLGVKAEPPPRIRVPQEELEAYAGTYRIESSGMTFDVSVRSGGLVVQLPTPPPDPSGRKLPAPKPIPMHLVAPDCAVASGGYLKGTRVEFIRGRGGRVEWIRLGARIHRKVDPARGERKAKAGTARG